MENRSPFTIIGTRVLEFKYKTYMDSGQTLQPEVSISYDVKYSTDEVYKAKLILNIVSKVKTKENKKFMDFNFKIEGDFEADKSSDINEDLFKRLSEQNGLITLLHMSRSILNGITSICGTTPAFILPMVNVIKLKEEHDSSINN